MAPPGSAPRDHPPFLGPQSQAGAGGLHLGPLCPLGPLSSPGLGAGACRPLGPGPAWRVQGEGPAQLPVLCRTTSPQATPTGPSAARLPCGEWESALASGDELNKQHQTRPPPRLILCVRRGCRAPTRGWQWGGQLQPLCLRVGVPSGYPITCRAGSHSLQPVVHAAAPLPIRGTSLCVPPVSGGPLLLSSPAPAQWAFAPGQRALCAQGPGLQAGAGRQALRL